MTASERLAKVAVDRRLNAIADEMREAVGADEWFAIPLAARLLIVRCVDLLTTDAEVRGAARVREAVEALADEWADGLAKGKCPDGDCAACAKGEAATDLRAALDAAEKEER